MADRQLYGKGKRMVEADVVVVGAGSAGCVVAARLSESPGLRVMLLEAGRRDRLGLTRLPSALVRAAGNARYDWNYTTEPDPTRNNRTDIWPRGRTLGGSSAINGTIWARGAPADYDAWEAMGCEGWSWYDVLPLFRRMEHWERPGAPDRGEDGPQHVGLVRWVHSLTPAFIASAMAAGIPFTDDVNGPRRDGVGYNQGSVIAGRRHSAYEAFIMPIERRRPNLRVLDGVLVERVLFEGSQAVGVRLWRDGAVVEVRARVGVVLTAGSINSPQLLMLSGIGPAEELRRHGIVPFVDSPEVGRNLMEHPGLHVPVEVDCRTGNVEAAPWRAPFHLLRWLVRRDGPISSPTNQVMAFFRSTDEAESSDLQFHLFPYAADLKDGRYRLVGRRNLLTILVNVNYPLSRGWLALRSLDPAQPVAIHPRLLDDPADLDGMLRGLDWLRRVAATPPFSEHVVRMLEAPQARQGRLADIEYLRSHTLPFLHPAGTCRMGPDARAVLTPQLQVRGTEGLWVADASIMPRHVAGNINATCMMIGEKAADLVRLALQATPPPTPLRSEPDRTPAH